MEHIILKIDGAVDGVPVRVDVGAIVTSEEMEGMYKLLVLLENEHLSNLTSVKLCRLNENLED